MVQSSEGGSCGPTWSSPVSGVAEISIPGTRGRLKQREIWVGPGRDVPSLARLPLASTPWCIRAATAPEKRPGNDLFYSSFGGNSSPARCSWEEAKAAWPLGAWSRSARLPSTSDSPTAEPPFPTAPILGSPSAFFLPPATSFPLRTRLMLAPRQKQRGLSARINPSLPVCQHSEPSRQKKKKKKEPPQVSPTALSPSTKEKRHSREPLLHGGQFPSCQSLTQALESSCGGV